MDRMNGIFRIQSKNVNMAMYALICKQYGKVFVGNNSFTGAEIWIKTYTINSDSKELSCLYTAVEHMI